MSTMALDDFDNKIIEAFSRDGRASNRQVAQVLDVTEGTIRKRVRRLQTRGLINFTAVRGYRFAGSPNLVMMGIHADQAHVSDIARMLAGFEELSCVIVMLGRYNILAMGLFTSLERVYELVNQPICSLPGVRRVETSVAIHNVKYRNSVARITRHQPPDDEEIFQFKSSKFLKITTKQPDLNL